MSAALPEPVAASIGSFARREEEANDIRAVFENQESMLRTPSRGLQQSTKISLSDFQFRTARRCYAYSSPQDLSPRKQTDIATPIIAVTGTAYTVVEEGAVLDLNGGQFGVVAGTDDRLTIERDRDELLAGRKSRWVIGKSSPRQPHAKQKDAEQDTQGAGNAQIHHRRRPRGNT